jgi:hypothetical protein
MSWRVGDDNPYIFGVAMRSVSMLGERRGAKSGVFIL